ncbi:hypothetical protein IFM89_032470, partial [Coptis chinensis]
QWQTKPRLARRGLRRITLTSILPTKNGNISRGKTTCIHAEFEKIYKAITQAKKLTNLGMYKMTLELVVKKLLSKAQVVEFLVVFAGIQDMVHKYVACQKRQKGKRRSTMNAHYCNLWKALKKSSVSATLILYTFVAAWFVGGLMIFQVYLICTNQTTYENFRAKLKKDYSSAVNTSLSLGHRLSLEMPKKSFDMEMGGIRHTHWDHKGNWEITPDIHALAAEFGMERGLTDREKIG